MVVVVVVVMVLQITEYGAKKMMVKVAVELRAPRFEFDDLLCVCVCVCVTSVVWWPSTRY